MSDFQRATAFKMRAIAQINTKVIYGVAITAGHAGGRQVAYVAPTTEDALIAAEKSGCFGFKPEGAQEVVVISAVKFDELLRLAGIAQDASPPASLKEPQ